MSEFVEVLEKRRTDVFGRLGNLQPEVASRLAPIPGPWPASPLGRIRIVSCEKTSLLITDGLSDPYDSNLHPKPPPTPLDYELCVEVLNTDPEAVNSEALARSVYVKLLYALADWMVPEWFDLRGRLQQFHAITVPANVPPPLSERLGYRDTTIGALIGIPIRGRNLDQQLFLHDFYQDAGTSYEHGAIGVFTVKPLHRDEYEHAVGLGNQGGVDLAERLLDSGEGHIIWHDQPSVLRST